MSNAIERIKAHADALGSVPHNPQFRADLYYLLAQFSEAQARLAEIERQEPVEAEQLYSMLAELKLLTPVPLHFSNRLSSLVCRLIDKGCAAPVPPAEAKVADYPPWLVSAINQLQGDIDRYDNRESRDPEFNHLMCSGIKRSLNTIAAHLRNAQRAAPVAPAAQAVADDVVRHIAAIAHDGGLRGVTPFDALSMIRRLTLNMWNKSGSIDDLRARVDAALLAAQQQTPGGAE